MNPIPAPAPAPRRLSRAFTLMEMVLSLAIFTIIGIACTSAILLATQAVTAATRPTTTASQVTSAKTGIDTLNSDLRTALRFTDKSPTSIAFTVPDRTGDGVPETIAYSWSGAGQPLKRSINGAAASIISDSVQSLAFDYDSYTVGPPPAPPDVESGETELSSYHTTGTTSSSSVKNTGWCAEYFKPTLPGNCISWKITRVVVQMKRLKTTSTPYSIEIHDVDANKKPTGPVLASVNFNSSTFSTTATWVSFPLATPLDGLDPTKAYAIVVRGTTSTNASLGVLFSTTTASTTRYWTTSTNSGVSWGTPSGTKSMQFFVYGTTTTN